MYTQTKNLDDACFELLWFETYLPDTPPKKVQLPKSEDGRYTAKTKAQKRYLHYLIYQLRVDMHKWNRSKDKSEPRYTQDDWLDYIDLHYDIPEDITIWTIPVDYMPVVL